MTISVDEIVLDDGKSFVKIVNGFLEPKIADDLFKTLFTSVNWMKVGVRECFWFGDVSYSYTGITHPACSDWPGALLSIKEAINKTFKTNANSALCNLYRNGRSCIPFHSDDESVLGTEPVIFSLSLGVCRQFVLINKLTHECYDCLPESGSLLIMYGKTQEFWRHSVPADNKIYDSRISVTFRQMF